MLSETRLKHMLGVARQCELLARDKGMTGDEQMACFLMGFMHDIGYESANEITKHPEESFKYIEAYLDNYKKCSLAILNHGTCKKVINDFDIILNTADLTINNLGELVTVEERLEGIKSRHGEDSIHYQHAVETARHYNLLNEEV